MRFQASDRKDFLGITKFYQGQVLFDGNTEYKVFTKISLKSYLVNALDTSLQGKEGYSFTATVGKK